MISAVIAITLSVVLTVSGFYLARWLFEVMAKKDFLVTFRTDGEIKAIMKGENCVRYVVKIENHIIDPDDHDIFKASLVNLQPMIDSLMTAAATRPGQPERKLVEKNGIWVLNPDFHARLIKANSPDWFERWFGVVWVGFPPYLVFSYKFRWVKYAQREVGPGETASDKVEMIPRDELVSSLFFRYPIYGLVVDNAETGAGKGHKGLERIQLLLDLVFETETLNPQKTLFRTAGLSSAGEWLSAISREIRDRIRVWIGQINYDLITTNKDEVENKLQLICEQVSEVAARDYGQKVTKISLVNVDLKDKSLQESIDKIFKAKQAVEAAEFKAKEDQEKARGDRALKAAEGLGLADGFAAIAAIADGAGTRMHIAQSLGGIKVLTVGGGSGGNMINLPDKLFENSPVPPSTPPASAP